MNRMTQGRVKLLALALAMGIILAGCAGGAEGFASSGAGAWLQGAALDAHDTPEALYQAALAEGGSLMVYTTTTRAMDTKDSFEKQYPGLVVEMRDMRSSYLVETLLAEYAAGGLQCDVVLCSDNSAAISGTLGPMGVMVRYIPWDMAGKLMYTTEENHLPFMTEAQVFCYNGAVWDAPPFTNIWELCEERFYGQVYVPNPISSYSTYSLFQALMREDAAMRDAYQRLHGTELDLPGDESAGTEFLRRLLANGLQVTNSSDEVAEAVGAPGVESRAVGSIISSKQRLNAVGYNLTMQYQLEPFAGISSRNSVMMASGTPRVNTAKLFIRWLLGEADGTGEGYRPFMQPGTWSVRVDSPDGDATAFKDIHLLEPDKALLHQDWPLFEAFWVDAVEDARAGAAP